MIEKFLIKIFGENLAVPVTYMLLMFLVFIAAGIFAYIMVSCSSSLAINISSRGF